jgi:signal transduction histidine kinase
MVWPFRRHAGRTGRAGSLVRTFAILALLTIALITTVQVALQWTLLRADLLEWERVAAAEMIRAEARTTLAADDFARWQTDHAQARFENFFRVALARPEIRRVKIYGRDGRIVWSDEPRLRGARHGHEATAVLKRALGGETIALLRSTGERAHARERGFAESIGLYVPLASASSTPGTARVIGVVEVDKDPGPLFRNFMRDRLVIVGTSLAGAAILYAALSWIVLRASRQIEMQQRARDRQARELEAANAELRATQEQLRTTERLAAIGEVSAAVAHAIRNPLANIRASAQVALDAPDDGHAARRYLDRIVGEVDRLGTWLEALLGFVRPLRLRRTAVDVNGAVDEALAMLDARLAAHRIAVERAFAADAPKVPADPALLRQAVLAVLENAVDAQPDGGRIQVRTGVAGAPAGSLVEIAVTDSGPGIAAEHVERVFEPFFTTKSRGTGLGLATARKIIEQHGGRADVESRPGAGTTVRLAFAVSEAS